MDGVLKIIAEAVIYLIFFKLSGILLNRLVTFIMTFFPDGGAPVNQQELIDGNADGVDDSVDVGHANGNSVGVHDKDE